MRSIFFVKISFIISILLGSLAGASSLDLDLDQEVKKIAVKVSVIPNNDLSLTYSLEFKGSIVKDLGTYPLNSLYMNPRKFDWDSFSAPFLEDANSDLIKELTSIIDCIKTTKYLYIITYK